MHPTPAAPDLAQTITDTHRVRVAVYPGPLEPPTLTDVAGDDAAWVIERVVDVLVPQTHVPPLALREIVENLVHAQFSDALVSVVDGGSVVRVTDKGSGIPDPDRAIRAGFTTAGPAEREIIRGAGAGLPLAAELLDAAGGSLSIEGNLGRGTVATLTVSDRVVSDAPAPALPSEGQRALLALLLELAEADAARLAAESGMSLAVCGRELAVLEHRGLLARSSTARRSLTGAGRDLVSSLF